MVYKGKVKNGVIVVEGSPPLLEGTDVEIVAINHNSASSEAEERLPATEDPIYSMADLAADTGITDLATNIDFYLYGHPKASDDRE